MSCHRSYMKASIKSSGGSCKGFKLRYSRRFSVQAFRVRVLFIFKIFKKWTFSYYQALKFLKKVIHAHDASGSDDHHKKIGRMSDMGSSRSHESRMRSLERSNSFYSEAIADCLEFIKRNSVSDDDIGALENNNLDSKILCKEKLEMVT